MLSENTTSLSASASDFKFPPCTVCDAVILFAASVLVPGVYVNDALPLIVPVPSAYGTSFVVKLVTCKLATLAVPPVVILLAFSVFALYVKPVEVERLPTASAIGIPPVVVKLVTCKLEVFKLAVTFAFVTVSVPVLNDTFESITLPPISVVNKLPAV